MTTTPCTACSGRGVVPRERRMIDGAADPLDFQHEELCSICGGAGAVPYQPPRAIPEKAIDAGDCCALTQTRIDAVRERILRAAGLL